MKEFKEFASVIGAAIIGFCTCAGLLIVLEIKYSTQSTRLITECQKELKRTEFCKLIAIPTTNTEGGD